MKCARCDFDGDLAEHAAAASHPLCIVCHRVLREDEPRTCERCLTRARANLRDIVELYALLPAELGRLTSGVDRQRGSGDPPLPGGEAMVLLGPGSQGTAARRLTTLEQRQGLSGREHGIDNEGNEVSVVQLLASWEDDVRHTYGDPAGGPATVAGSAGYLERRMRWMANNHDAFDEFFADVKRLLARLKNVTQTSERVVVAPADCFDCGGRLVREWTDKGLEDDWHCEACDRTYTHEAYFLAVRARLEQEAS